MSSVINALHSDKRLNCNEVAKVSPYKVNTMHPNLKQRLGTAKRGGFGAQNNPYSRPATSKKQSKKSSLPIKTWGVIFKDLDPIPTDPTIDPPPKTCYNCWQKGHSQRTCPRPKVGRFCNNCGRRNVEINTCPRCKRRNAEYLSEFRKTGKTLQNTLIQRFDGDEAPDDVEQYNEESEYVLRELIRQDEEARRLREQADALLLAVQPASGLHSKYDDEYDDEPVVIHTISSSSKFDRFTDARDYNRRRPVKTISSSNGSSSRRSPSPPPPPSFGGGASSRRLAMQSGRLDDERESSPTPAIVGDPVKEVRLLIKSIEHLSKDTQELIIRQVMAERREKLKAEQGRDEEAFL
ncbi:hypothetical protein QAD02_019194 [Eretmocerus hayati]|uniref:Uncharacterized protein n=1 Tax=Eretmocerus hayati TaxID=131215 RepID=A0ACC2PIW6_9HYME|nr:hypothetical protein QAD02_019194 [Eretmocerus hayati]